MAPVTPDDLREASPPQEPDFDAIAEVLNELGLPAEYSPEAIEKINEAANVLCDEAADLKRADAPREERRAVMLRVDAHVAAREYLAKLRPASPEDYHTA